jgi:hypothetical protein
MSHEIVERVELAEESPNFAVLATMQADFGKLPIAAARVIMV